MKKKLCVVISLGLLVSNGIALTKAIWDYTYTGNSITNAANWFDPSNWENNIVADSAAYHADLSGAVGIRFIKIGAPLTIGEFTGTASGSNMSVLVSDDPLTFYDPDRNYHIRAGYYFADITSSEFTGTRGNGRCCGTITAPTRFTLGSENCWHRLDWYAKSSDPLRTNDLNTPQIYRGSAGWYVVGPRSAAAVDGQWHVTAGSPYVFLSGTKHVVAAGTIVTADNIFPAGTFVKRIFPDDSLELSAPAAIETESGIKTLNFAAFAPQTRYTIEDLYTVTWADYRMAFMKHAEEDDFRVIIKKLTTPPGVINYTFLPEMAASTSLLPATIVIHNGDTENAGNLEIKLGTCHLEFAETGAENTESGFPHSPVCFYNSATTAKARFTVTNNITASIGNFTNWTGTVTKDGLGELIIAATNLTAKNIGSLIVSEGKVVLTAGTWIKSVEVASGATLQVLGDFTPDSVVLEPGAIVEGPGTLALTASSQLSEVSFVNDPAIRLPDAGELFNEPPAANVVGTPAFWVDFSRTDTMIFKDNDGESIARIDDVRGSEYGFATNAINYPQLIRDENNNPHHVRFTRLKGGSMDIDSCDDLVWDKPITKIRTVFQVQDTNEGGGQFLGKTSRISGAGDFMRAAENGGVYTRGVVHNSSNQQKVWGGIFYVNGDRRDMFAGYPYKGGGNKRYLDGSDRTTLATWWTPHVDSVETTANTAADCFSFNSAAGGRSGYRRICECLIYTNTVTESERLAITSYLMQKWLNCEVNYSRSFETASVLDELDTAKVKRLAVADNQTAYIGKITDTQGFVKSDAGTLWVDDYANPDGALHVAGGTLILKSTEPTIADLPGDAYFHVDASRLDTFTTNILESGKTRVSRWNDQRGTGYPYAYLWNPLATNYATLKMDALNGKPAVDFGAYLADPTYSWAEKWLSPAMMFESCSNLRSALFVYGSAQGGGSIVGSTQRNTHGTTEGFGIQRATGLGGNPATPMIMSSYGTAYYNLILPGGMRTRLNGEYVNATETGLSGSWDLISMVSYEAFGAGGFSSNNYNKDVGGQEIAEAIFYKQGLSRETTAKAEAYLAKKWFGRETPGFRPATAGSLIVDAGATLELVGNHPIDVAALAGEGTINGGVNLVPDSVIEVTVKPDGTVDTLIITGNADFSQGGTVRLVGPVDKLLYGKHILVEAGSMDIGEGTRWRVAESGSSGGMAFSAKITNNQFIMDVFPSGTLMLIR